MGIITSLRRAAKRQRALGIIIVIVLSIGLVGSYALFYLPNAKGEFPTGGTGEDNIAQQAEAIRRVMEEQIDLLEGEIEVAQKQLQANPEDVAMILRLGDSYYSLGGVYYMLGETEQVAEKIDTALDNYRQALVINPQEKGVYARIARAFFDKGDLEAAADNYRIALQSEAEDNTARLEYGYLQFVQEKYQEAIEQWQQILDFNPDEEMEMQVNNLIEQAQAAMEAAGAAESEGAAKTEKEK